MPTAYLNIGSNQGDRRALIERAVALIVDSCPGSRVRLSDYVESEPWGYDSAASYLNVGVAIDMDASADPEALLDSMQEIERTVGSMPHRNADGTYRDRDIDIDIIAIEGVRMQTPRLTLPHPRARMRDFVVGPLVQLVGTDRDDVMQRLLS